MKQTFDYNKSKDEFTKEMLKDTLKYQKKYGFDIFNNHKIYKKTSPKSYA